MAQPRSPVRQAIDRVLADGQWHTLDEIVEQDDDEFVRISRY